MLAPDAGLSIMTLDRIVRGHPTVSVPARPVPGRRSPVSIGITTERHSGMIRKGGILWRELK